jgi:hypothetical protein
MKRLWAVFVVVGLVLGLWVPHGDSRCEWVVQTTPIRAGIPLT